MLPIPNAARHHLRQNVGTSPWRRVFDVIIARHMLRYYRHGVALALSQLESAGEARDTGTVTWLAARADVLAPVPGTHPRTTIADISVVESVNCS